jgi:rod shape determining protein RodA
MGKRAFHFDWITAVLLVCIGVVGLFVLLTISRDLFIQQAVFLVIGIALLWATSRIDNGLLWWLAPFGYVIGCLFLATSYLGPEIRGATRWIFIAGVQLQPSEIVKPLFILAFARFLTMWSPRDVHNLPKLAGLFAIPFLLVFRQPDLGTSIVYAGSWFAMMLAGGLSVVLVIGAAVVLGILLPFIWGHLAPYQQARIETFLNPALDPKGAGYNALQSTIAVGSGQLFGRGLGRGTQSHLRFLPEYHTDFIFATLVEELGLLGGGLLLIGYAGLLWRIISPFLRGIAGRVFPFLYSAGLFGTIVTQVFINAGMNMGLLPITGITLPFVSYGGSSILSLAISFGFLFALIRQKDDQAAIAIE